MSWQDLSGAQRSEITDLIYERDRGVCHLCRLAVRREDASVDHLIPEARGGESTLSNLALAHRRCNYSRGDKAIASTADSQLVHDGLSWFLE